MALLLVLLQLLTTAVLVTSKGVMLLQQGQQQTFAYALEEMPTAPLEDHVLDILELEEPPSTFIRRKRNDRVAEFMAQLFHELQDDVESTETNELAGSEDWSSADRIVSFTPTDAQFSNGLTVVTFHRDDLPNLSPSHLIAAQLRIFLPSEMTIAKVFVMSNRTGAPILLDSTIATSRETTVGLNVTEVVAEWMEGTSKPTLLIGIDSG
ncbi:unnamed protein product [Nippostrongylus brasiliensis]|uniref:TGFb_propeptide domain-containing protein n=1 Tax=Nippostrongylus brasiliensis TaxID=27835 RepID=A0A0N4XE28_NIPBR|nr:unnamed protein product [Nippostrongylus brasiliensis]